MNELKRCDHFRGVQGGGHAISGEDLGLEAAQPGDKEEGFGLVDNQGGDACVDEVSAHGDEFVGIGRRDRLKIFVIQIHQVITVADGHTPGSTRRVLDSINSRRDIGAQVNQAIHGLDQVGCGERTEMIADSPEQLGWGVCQRGGLEVFAQCFDVLIDHDKGHIWVLSGVGIGKGLNVLQPTVGLALFGPEVDDNAFIGRFLRCSWLGASSQNQGCNQGDC